MAVGGRNIFRHGVVAALGAAALLAGRLAWSAGEARSLGDAQKVEYFEKEVKPLLEAKCFKCHGGEAKIKGGLRLTSRAGVMKGGDTGPAISIEAPAKSLLLKAISYTDEDLQMPPKE